MDFIGMRKKCMYLGLGTYQCMLSAGSCCMHRQVQGSHETVTDGALSHGQIHPHQVMPTPPPSTHRHTLLTSLEYIF